MSRRAFDIGNANNLLLQLRLSGSRSKSHYRVSQFCVHLDHPSTSTSHRRFRVSSGQNPPDAHLCGPQSDRMTYQLSRHLWRHFRDNPEQTLESIHQTVDDALKKLSTICIVCGTFTGLHMLRPKTCSKICSIQFRQAGLGVRVSDLNTDPVVTDLLLTSIGAAASHKSWTSLCPGMPVSDPMAVIELVKNIPALHSLTGSDLRTTVGRLDVKQQALIAYTSTKHRGFLMSAPENMLIPKLNNIQQFLFVDASREKEAEFAQTLAGGSKSPEEPHIVFHGTSVDRLYAILRDGLKVCSGTPFQRNGAASGKGIYTSTHPSTAAGYATQYFPTGNRSGNGAFKAMRIILGCELANKSRFARAGELFLVTDESCLMVRFVFVLDAGATLPIASILAPEIVKRIAIMRSIKGIRLGSAK